MQPNHPHAPYAPAQYHGSPLAIGYRQNVFVPYGASAGPLVGPTLRGLQLVSGIVQLVMMIAGVVFVAIGVHRGEDGGGVFLAIGAGLFGIWYLALLGHVITGMIWLYKFWSWIPPDQRHSTMWKKYISPGTAVVFMLIPYFNFYWAFVIFLGIADILERMRVEFPTNKPSAKTLAILTVAIPMVFLPSGPFLHYFFAKHVEEMAKDMQPRMMGVAGSLA